MPLFTLAAAAGATSVALASGTAGAAGSSGLPAVVNVPVVMSMSGAAGLPGSHLVQGMQFAASQLNKQHFLGKSKVKLVVHDDQTDTNRATQLVTSVVRSKPPAFLGPGVSALALTTAPIAEQAKIPYVATEAVDSGLDPLLTNKSYIYRLTPPESNYQKPLIGYLQAKKIKSVAILYISDGAAQAEWATKTMPTLLKKPGIKIVDTESFPETQTDFSALATKLAQENPDAIGIASFSSQNPTLFTQIRQAGYKGLIFGEGSFGGGSLAGAGSYANGAVWDSDYAPFIKQPSSVTFTKAWEKAHGGTAPDNFQAEGFDGARFLIQGLKLANSINPAKVQIALNKLTQGGYTPGALGKIKFHGTHDASSPGVLNVWLNGKQTSPKQ